MNFQLPKWGPVGWTIFAFILFFVVTQPDSAAAIISKGIDGLGFIANGASEFVSQTAL